MLAIPFPALPAFTETVTLEGQAYRFSFAWNYRGKYWSMAISDTNGNPLVQGRRLTLDQELISQFPGRGLPPRELYAVDPSGALSEPGYDDLSAGRVLLIYLTEAEVAAA